MGACVAAPHRGKVKCPEERSSSDIAQHMKFIFHYAEGKGKQLSGGCSLWLAYFSSSSSL